MMQAMVIVVAVMATTTAAQTDEYGMLNLSLHDMQATLLQYNSLCPKIMTIGRDADNNLSLNGGTATLSLANPTQPATSSNNLLAYRPRFLDAHHSGLTGVFINLKELFPCNTGHGMPSCTRFTHEEDGFNGGKAILQAADNGNNFKSLTPQEKILLMVLHAVQGCEYFNTDCFPAYYEIRVICLLPRKFCG